MQEEGKIKYIGKTPRSLLASGLHSPRTPAMIVRTGLNNAGVKQLDEAWATGIRFHTLQVRYHMFSRKEIEAEIAPCTPPRPFPLRGLGCVSRESQT